MSAEIIDVDYGGREGVMGAWLVDDVLIDCGPAAGVERLLEGLAGRRPRRLLLTHIHFDHAGATGALVARWPDLEVYVHPVGARHLIDPARLVASARRVFGERFDGLVGEVIPVPEENVRTIDDGMQIGRFRSAWTPGHAVHHVAFLDEESGRAFPGDIAGVRLASGAVIPPTPPPDIDVDAWRSSLRTLEDWAPRRLALPHFGEVEDPAAHLVEFREALVRHEGWAREGEDMFVERLARHLRERVGPGEADDSEFISLARPSAQGLRRALERRDGPGWELVDGAERPAL
jgi:glyoxylase-like metal-dependent hydrolase (beta-lactamase superfamily II)